MWEPRRITTLWSSMAPYRDSFIFYSSFVQSFIKRCLQSSVVAGLILGPSLLVLLRPLLILWALYWHSYIVHQFQVPIGLYLFCPTFPIYSSDLCFNLGSSFVFLSMLIGTAICKLQTDSFISALQDFSCLFQSNVRAVSIVQSQKKGFNANDFYRQH
jgi:hypothetical protein